MKRILSSLIMACLSVLTVTAACLGAIHSKIFIYGIELIEHIRDIRPCGWKILLNVEAAPDCFNPSDDSDFDLSDLTYSKSGAEHFRDCEFLFTLVYFSDGWHFAYFLQ